MSGLVTFVVDIIAILAAGGIFGVSIDKVAPDAFFARVAKIAIGALLLIALVIVVASVFGLGGGVTVAPLGVVWFAIAVIVAVVVLYVVNLVIDWIATAIGISVAIAPFKYVLGAVVLVGLMVAAANLLFGAHFGAAGVLGRRT